MQKKLTKTTVENAKPEDKDVIIRDTEIKGFICKITPKGRKSYMLYYRTSDGKERRPVIGVHGSITCEQARETAKQWSAKVINGEDPSQERKASKQIPTLAELGERYLEDKKYLIKPRSWYETKRILAKDIVPAFGNQKITQLNADDVRRYMRKNAHRKTAANRIFEIIRAIINHAMKQEWIELEKNPCLNIQKYPEKSRERFLSKTEVKRLFETLDECEQDRSESPSVTNLVRLLLLTGCRLSEVLTLKWDYISWDSNCIRLPDSKTGAKTIYLSPDTATLLKGIPKVEKHPYVLPGKLEGQPLNPPQKAWRRIRKRAGLDDVRFHDLRHSFASIGAQNGLSLPMIGALLGHKDSQTTARYAHLIGEPLHQAASVIGDSIRKATE